MKNMQRALPSQFSPLSCAVVAATSLNTSPKRLLQIKANATFELQTDAKRCHLRYNTLTDSVTLKGRDSPLPSQHFKCNKSPKSLCLRSVTHGWMLQQSRRISRFACDPKGRLQDDVSRFRDSAPETKRGHIYLCNALRVTFDSLQRLQFRLPKASGFMTKSRTAHAACSHLSDVSVRRSVSTRF